MFCVVVVFFSLLMMGMVLHQQQEDAALERGNGVSFDTIAVANVVVLLMINNVYDWADALKLEEAKRNIDTYLAKVQEGQNECRW